MRGGSAEQAESRGLARGLGAGFDRQLAQNRGDMVIDGLRRQEKTASDLQKRAGGLHLRLVLLYGFRSLIAGEPFADLGLALDAANDERLLTVDVTDRSAEQDDAFLGERIHEGRVLVPTSSCARSPSRAITRAVRAGCGGHTGQAFPEPKGTSGTCEDTQPSAFRVREKTLRSR